MKVSIELDDALLARALSNCVERKVEFEAFIAAAIREALDDPEVSDAEDVDITGAVARTVAFASELAPGSEFHIDDVCPPSDWTALNSGERKIFGKAFRKAVEGSLPAVAVHVGRTSGNKAIYRRV
ncbi:DUF1413 domain-containing protein [Massilia sp. HP4]|uniref:DUF1413 domain-containing protein n=1 Tax=Massilia sp. HP4 TaxID=2562316 RepID=UPI0010C01961|nr:DUF1413 domain-containing protein [Massilia sp. HP4]